MTKANSTFYFMLQLQYLWLANNNMKLLSYLYNQLSSKLTTITNLI